MGAFHLFICHSSKDAEEAREVVDFLETHGLKCWISSRDVPAGRNYQEQIVLALESAQGIVFLFSESSSKSGEINKELSIGGSINIPVFPLRLSSIMPSGALRYELATRQWIDIFPDRQYALGKLAETIKAALDPAAPGMSGAAARTEPAPRAASAAAGAVHAPLVAPGSRGFEAIRTLLAHHIGPIAKIYVEKAANEALTPDDFCERLATHVAAPAERTSFVRAVRAQLADKS